MPRFLLARNVRIPKAFGILGRAAPSASFPVPGARSNATECFRSAICSSVSSGDEEQFVSLHALLDHYGPGVFAEDPAAKAVAENVLARKREEGRLGQMRRAVPTVADQR